MTEPVADQSIRPLQPPAGLNGRRLTMSDGSLRVRALFPATGHIYQALVCGLTLSVAFGVLVFVSVLAQPSLSPLKGRAVVIVVALAMAAKFIRDGLRGLLRIRPIELTLGQELISLSGPRVAGIEQPSVADASHAYAVFKFSPQSVRRTRLGLDGLELFSESRLMLIPRSYSMIVGARSGTRVTLSVSCFDQDELVYLDALLRRRCREPSQPVSLEGWATQSELDVAEGTSTTSSRAWLPIGPVALRLIVIGLSLLPALALLVKRLG